MVDAFHFFATQTNAKNASVCISLHHFHQEQFLARSIMIFLYINVVNG